MRKTLAVVDDQVDARESVKDHYELTLPKLKVRTFAGGKEILEAMDRGETFDVVLMDGKLEDGIKGPYYTAKILKRSPDTPVIGYSVDKELEENFLSHGAKVFLRKGSLFRTLDDTVRKFAGL